MKCEKCNEREASVFLEQTINGESRSLHLCHDCAKIVQKEGFFETPFPFGADLFGGLFGLSAPTRTSSSSKTCPDCGATFALIRREGKVCCPRCYDTFAEELSPTIHSLHGKVTHTGRAPAGLRVAREKQTRLSTLQNELKNAIAAEEYEKAATLRDEIRAIEKEGN